MPPEPSPSTQWELRNQRAREQGYRNEYDRRVHAYGALPPSEPVTAEMRRAYRGHAGLRDLVAAINRGTNRPVEIQPWGAERAADGRWRTIMVGAVFQNQATGRTYRLVYYLRGAAASSANLRALRENIAHPGSRRPSGAVQRPSDAGSTVEGDQDEGGGEGYDEEEDDFEGSYYDYWDYVDDYPDYDPIPFIPAASVGEFAS